MKIYTKTGDAGKTGLFGGPRIAKDDPRIEAYGAVDELNAAIGVARSESLPAEIDALLARIQSELFDLGAELATPDPAKHGMAVLGPPHFEALEQAIDRHEAGLPPLKEFILPGGCRGAAALHLARTICRRAERRLVTLVDLSADPVSPNLVIYLNRLGDLLFVAHPGDECGGGSRGCSVAERVIAAKWRVATRETASGLRRRFRGNGRSGFTLWMLADSLGAVWRVESGV